jgi:hypothetical protein
MGIGLLSLLTLFPLGALNMAQAIKDTRCAHAAANAAALARVVPRNARPPACAKTFLPALIAAGAWDAA